MSEKDIDELACILRAEHGIPVAGVETPPAVPIELPEGGGEVAAEAVSLSALKDLHNINALADDQPLHFPAVGVTVIYGDNGSGKSGFGRLLRTVCWARKRPQTILKNIDSHDPRPQQAVVGYRIGSAEQPQFTWTPACTPPAELGRIAVYDAECAVVYLNEEQQAAYVPFGLDYFPRLAAVCDRVKEKLKAARDASAAELSMWPDVDTATDVGRQLASLPLLSAIAFIEGVSPLTAEEQKHREHLSKLLDDLRREDPHKQVLALRSEARGLAGHRSRITAIRAVLADDKVGELRSAFQDLDTKTAAARAASDKALGSEVLPETGGKVWEELWNAARKYSELAYPGVSFPACEHGERCLLCQQVIQPDAQKRLKAFDEFVRDEAATQAQRANARIAQLKSVFNGLVCVRPEEHELFEGLDLKSSGLGATFRDWLSAAERRRLVLASATGPDVLAVLPVIPSDPSEQLKSTADDLEARASSIEASIDDEARAKNERELAELSARAWVCEHRKEVAEEIEKRKRHQKLEKLLGAPTSTAKITNTGNVLAETHITQLHKERFHAELDALRAANLGVELDKRGVKGRTLHQLLLTRGTGHAVASVLSTGERNIVGLAAFFAELEPDSGHGIVLDDPVSSLDQDRRDDVAKRIAVEGKKRQVIIWTHDLPFVGALFEATEQVNGPASTVVTVTNLNGTAGVVDERLPWPLMKINERIKRLEEEVKELEALAQKKDAKGYTDAGRLFYGRLRDTWERAVEEVLLNEAIVRWRKSVQPTRLKKIADKVTRADFEAIDGGMAQCSRYVHDQRNQTPAPVPTTDQMKKDLAALRDWVKQKRAPTA